MKSGSLPKKTIARSLWLGFGLMVLVLAIIALIYYWQIQRIESDVARVVEIQEPVEEAVLEMQMHTGTIARAVSDYLRTGDPAHADQAHDAELGFEIAHMHFNELAQTNEASNLGQEIAGLFENVAGKHYRVMSLSEQQNSTLLFFRQDIKEVDAVIGGMLHATMDGNPTDALNKIQLALGMRDSLNKVSIATEAYSTGPDIALQQEVAGVQEDFRQYSIKYRETGLTSYEASWLDYIDAGFVDTAGSGVDVMAVTDELYGLTAAFDDSIEEMDAFFGEQVRPWASAQAIDASREVQAATGSATTALLVLGIIGIIIGGASVWVLARQIIGPIRELADGASVIASGRLHHRFNIDAGGELGHMAHSLNQMLENLGRSQEALGESEELAWALLDATNDAVILTDRQGTILATNEVAAGRFGKSLEQMVDESLYDLLPDTAVASMKAHIAEAVKSGKPVHYEDEREGKITDQNIYPVPTGRGDISRIAIFFRDITVRKWVEDVTEQLARRNQLILEAAGEGIFGLDTKGTATFVNPAAARMLGYKPEELVGQHHHELVHHTKPGGKPYPNQDCPIYAAFKDGKVRTSVDDEVFWRKDGSSFAVEYTSTPIIDDGRILGAVVTFCDITVRKHVEQALRLSEERYRSILESAANLILSVDKEGIIVDCSALIQHMIGYTPSEVIGQRLVEIIHPDERNTIQESLKEVLSKGFEYDHQYRMIAKDGSPVEVGMNAAATRDASGQYVRIICMINRITEVVRK
ncbi:PAS domain S-box protein [Chloroflexota bacterium]